MGISWVSPAECDNGNYSCSPKDCQDRCTAENAVIPTKADLWKLAVAGMNLCNYVWFIDTSAEKICIGFPMYSKRTDNDCGAPTPEDKPRIVGNFACKNLNAGQTWDTGYATNPDNDDHTANCACIKMDGVHQQP